MSISRKYLYFTFWGLLLAVAAPDRFADPLRFQLVPVQFWSDPLSYSLNALPDGRVSFYRRGEMAPALQVAVGQKIELPPGEWIFTAEAPGYVGVAAGKVNTVGDRVDYQESAAGDANNSSSAKSIYWWVVPACQIILRSMFAEGEADQLGYISLEYGIRTPFPVQELGSEIQAPAGKTILYLAKEGRILGMSPIFDCTASGSVSAPRVAPPAEGYFDVLLICPRGSSGETKNLKRLALVSSRQSRTVGPSLQVSNSLETLAIFRNVPLAGDWQVAGSSRTRTLFAAGGEPESGKVYEFELEAGH